MRRWNSFLIQISEWYFVYLVFHSIHTTSRVYTSPAQYAGVRYDSVPLWMEWNGTAQLLPWLGCWRCYVCCRYADTILRVGWWVLVLLLLLVHSLLLYIRLLPFSNKHFSIYFFRHKVVDINENEKTKGKKSVKLIWILIGYCLRTFFFSRYCCWVYICHICVGVYIFI